MTQATKWETILDLLSKNQELSMKLLIAIHQTTKPKTTPSLQPNPRKMPKLESKAKVSTKRQVQSTPSLDDLKQELKQAKDTLRNIEASLSTAASQPQKVKKRRIKPIQSQRQCRTLQQNSQFNPAKEVVIAGLAYAPEEDLRWKVKLIAQSKGMQVGEGDIVRCFRALNKDSETKKNNKGCPLVIVEWATNQMKQEFKRHKPLSSGEATTIYINENLDPAQKALFFEARGLRRKFPDLIVFVWTRDGECFVRGTDTEAKVKVKSKKDIQTLEAKLQKIKKKTVDPVHTEAIKVATLVDGGSTHPKS